MSLKYSYHRAAKIVCQLPPESRPLLTRFCRKIQEAERNLNSAAEVRLQGCLQECQGLCCRNLDLEAVFGVPDFVYILTLDPSLHSAIAACLETESSIFTSNCPFLEHGVGPCIFPADLRPEVCITSFCRSDGTLGAEIRRVKTGFWRLGLLLRFRRLPFIHRRLIKTV
jgi:hypothetical protein